MDKIKLSKISSIVYGYPFDSKLFSNQSNGFGIIRIRDIKSGFTSTFTLENNIDNKYLVKNGDILIGMDGEFNISRWKGNDAYLNQRVCKISSDIFLENFLCYSLHNKLKQIEEQTSYVTVKHLSSKILENILIENYNLQTQQKIVEELDCLSDIIEKKKQQLADLDNLIKSQFIDMFGSLKDMKTSDIKMKDVVEINPKKDTLDSNCLVTFIPMEKVGTDGSINTSNLRKYVEVKNGFSQVKENDILFAKITPCMENGKSTIARNLHNGYGNCTTELLVLRCGNKVLPEYIYTIVHSKEFRIEAEKNMSGSAGQKRVPKSFLEEYPILLPDIAMQNKFANFVKHIDKLKFELKQSIEETQNLFNERMQHYFGE